MMIMIYNNINDDDDDDDEDDLHGVKLKGIIHLQNIVGGLEKK